jgi:hypothetical protein
MEPTETVRINADTYALNESSIQLMKDTLLKSPGNQPVEIALNGQKTVRLGEEFNVNPGGLDVMFDLLFGDSITVQTTRGGK